MFDTADANNYFINLMILTQRLSAQNCSQRSKHCWLKECCPNMDCHVVEISEQSNLLSEAGNPFVVVLFQMLVASKVKWAFGNLKSEKTTEALREGNWKYTEKKI